MEEPTQTSETGMTHRFASEFAKEIKNSYALIKLSILNIWQQITFFPHIVWKPKKTYLEAIPAAHVNTQITVRSDLRRLVCRDTRDLSTVNFPKVHQNKTCW